MSRKKLLESEKNLTSIGKRFKQFEIAIGLKPRQICEKLDIQDSYWSDLKYGRLQKGNFEFWKKVEAIFPEWVNFLMEEPDTHKEILFIREKAFYNTSKLNNIEQNIIKALKEIDNPLIKIGIYNALIIQINEARKDKEIRRNKRKREILDKAIHILGKAISDTS